MTLKQAIDEFTLWKGYNIKKNTNKGYNRILMYWCIFLRNPDIKEIALTHIMEYLNWLKEFGWEPASIQRQCLALRHFIQYCNEMGYTGIRKSLIPLPKRDYTTPRVIDPESYKKLITWFEDAYIRKADPRTFRNMVMCMMFWDTGVRNGELCNLRVEDLNLKERKAFIKTEKQRMARPYRWVFWSDETQRQLLKWFTIRADYADPTAGPVFVSLMHQKQGMGMMQSGVGSALIFACRKAKISPFNPHSFRHAVGHRIIANGGSNAHVAAVLGHSSYVSSQRYVMLQGKEEEEAWRQFAVDKSC